ncbi:hypothetical protein ACP275_06G075800 [Erythranthe tilingii]
MAKNKSKARRFISRLLLYRNDNWRIRESHEVGGKVKKRKKEEMASLKANVASFLLQNSSFMGSIVRRLNEENLVENWPFICGILAEKMMTRWMRGLMYSLS